MLHGAAHKRAHGKVLDLPYGGDEEQIADTSGHVGSLTGAWWHPLRAGLVWSASTDGTVRLWDMDTALDGQIALLCPRPPPGDSRSPVRAAASAGAGALALLADGRLAWWDERVAARGGEVRPAQEVAGAEASEGEGGAPSAVAAAPDGWTVATRGGGAGAGATLWDLRALRARRPLARLAGPEWAASGLGSALAFAPPRAGRSLLAVACAAPLGPHGAAAPVHSPPPLGPPPRAAWLTARGARGADAQSQDGLDWLRFDATAAREEEARRLRELGGWGEEAGARGGVLVLDPRRPSRAPARLPLWSGGAVALAWGAAHGQLAVATEAGRVHVFLPKRAPGTPPPPSLLLPLPVSVLYTDSLPPSGQARRRAGASERAASRPLAPAIPRTAPAPRPRRPAAAHRYAPRPNSRVAGAWPRAGARGG